MEQRSDFTASGRGAAGAGNPASAFSPQSSRPTGEHDYMETRRGYLREAQRLAAALQEAHPGLRLRSTLKDLIPFVYSA